jgi:hypothetical protein
MARVLIAVAALLGVALAVLVLVVFASRDEDRVAVDDMLALELTRAIGTSGRVDLRALAGSGWDRVLVVAPGTSRAVVSAALGSEFKGDLPFGSTGELFVFARGDELARFADYRGRARFAGFARPIDALPRARAVLRVRDGVVRSSGSGAARGAAPSSSRAPWPWPAARGGAAPDRADAARRRGPAPSAYGGRRA